MSKQSIVERILSDAEDGAKAIISSAEKSAAETVAEAEERARRNMLGTDAEIAEKSKAIFDGKAASARLDSAKILLAEKRRAIDEIYAQALNKLSSLGESDAVKLSAELLEEYAEDGDEIVFSANFKYISSVAELAVVKAKKLKVSPKSEQNIDGGFILRGKISDKDLSFGALLQKDREDRQAEIAAQIFKG